MALDRHTVRRAVLRKEAVRIDSLGDDEVIVRQLKLTELLELGRLQLEREVELLQVLTWCVVDEQGAPLLTADDWQAWGASHPDDAAQLYAVANRLTDVEKKTPATA